MTKCAPCLSRWRVLARYLLRAFSMPPELRAAVQVLDTASSLALPPSLVLFVLTCLVHDVLETDEIREGVEENLSAALELARAKHLEEVEERKKAAEEAAAAAQAERAKKAQEKQQAGDGGGGGEDGAAADKDGGKGSKEGKEGGKGGEDGEDGNVVFEVAEEFKEFKGDPNDRKAVLAFKERQRKEEERVSRCAPWRLASSALICRQCCNLRSFNFPSPAVAPLCVCSLLCNPICLLSPEGQPRDAMLTVIITAVHLTRFQETS